MRGIVTQAVESYNAEGNERSALLYQSNRDSLREALQRLLPILAKVEESMRHSAADCEVSKGPVNLKLVEIEEVLNIGSLPRISFHGFPLPAIDSGRVCRGELLAAIEGWIGALC